MKKLFFVLAFLLLCLVTVTLAQAQAASTYITFSSPVPAGANQPTFYIITEGTVAGGVFTATKTYPDSPVKANSDGTVNLWFDTSVMAVGNKTVTFKAKNSAGTSAATAPWSFTLPVAAIPLTPTGVPVLVVQ